MRIRPRWYVERSKPDTRERGGTSWLLRERTYPKHGMIRGKPHVELDDVRATFHSRTLARKVARLLNGSK